MKKNIAKIILIVLPVIVIICFICFNKKEKQLNDYINISELSDEFMEEYFEEISLADTEDKENMLIVISDKEIKNTYGAKNVINAPNNQYILEYSSEEEKNNALSKLKKDDSIYSVEENIVYTIDTTNYNSWGIEEMSLDYAIDTANINTQFMQQVTVAIIDTGCDLALFNKYYGGKILEYYNILTNSSDKISDEDGHGTHIAGTIAEGTPDNVKILPIKVSSDGYMYNTDIVAAINYIVTNNKADVINMSFGSYYKSEAIEEAINAANQKNIISVAAAGNDNTSKDNYPSGLDNTISISSIDSELNKSSFSNYGSTINFAAPGTNIRSIMGKDTIISSNHGNNDDDDHEIISGTSMATPHAVAAVAILKGYNKNLTLENVINILKENTIDLGDPGWDQYYGYGLISFKDVEFCDGSHCDELGVYKDLTKTIVSINSTNLQVTPYNYYSLTNIIGSKINVTYSDGTSEDVELGSITNLEILDYDPTLSGGQEVTIKIGNLTSYIGVYHPENNYESGWIYDDLGNDQIEITGYKSHGLELEKLYVPETIDSKQVVAFADNVKFSEISDDFASYKYIYLPRYFNKIGDYTLAETGIQYVYADSTGVEVGNHAFESSSVVKVEIPITKLGDYAFKDCLELTKVSLLGKRIGIDNYRLSIGEYSFFNCKKLTSVIKFEDKKIDIYDVNKYAFYNCIMLSNFPFGIQKNIEEYAFYNTFTLTNLNLNNSDSIGRYAFYNSGIATVNFSTQMQQIEVSSFENCRNLTTVQFSGKRIESKAFWNSGIETLSVGGNVEYIAEDAFAYNPVKNCNGCNSNDIYSTVSDMGIVEKSTNKLIVGFTDHKYGRNTYSNSNIDETITEIGKYAFTGNNNLRQIVIPASITNIGEYAFKDCYNLSKVYMLGSSIEFDDDTFIRTYEGDIKNEDLFIYVHKNSQIKDLVNEYNLNYRNIEPDEVVVSGYQNTYKALSQVSFDTLSVKLIYHEEEDREEELTTIKNNVQAPISTGVGFYIIYQTEHAYNLQYGDTYFTVSAKNELGYETLKNINITVEKATPNYTVPTNLTANLGQKLSSVELPNNFEWMDGNQTINEAGDVIFKAKYIPQDTNNYEIVENIDITISVSNTKIVVNPTISVSNKTYDGNTNISTSNITITGLTSNEYSIISATSSSADAGNRTANIKLKLTDDKFNDYSFDNGKQEKEFNIDFTISKANINVVDNSTDVTIQYDGNPHSIQMNLNYDQNIIIKYMDENEEYTLDLVPTYTNVGTYNIKYKAYIDDNYNEYFGEKTLRIQEIIPYEIKNYSVDVDNNYISKIDVNTEVNAFTPNFILGYGYGIDVDTKNVEGKNVLYTGGKTRITHGLQLYKEFTNIVSGDTNGDGKINYLDYVNVYNHIQKTKHPESNKQLLLNEYLIAADMSDDNKINYLDYVRIYNKIKELKGGN